MPKENQRIIYLDVLRIIATFGVIVLHVSCQGFYSDFCPSWYLYMSGDSIVRWSVPIFVMISGTLFLNPDKNITYRAILLKYVPRLIIAYLFWAIIYYFVFDYDNDFSIRELVLSDTYFHLWFLPMFAGVYLLIPILRKIIEDVKLIRYSLLLWLFILQYAFISTLLPFKSSQIMPLFVINSSFGYAGYFILGYFLSQCTFTKKAKLWIILLGALFTIIMTAIISIHRGKPCGLFYKYHCPNVIVMAIALFVWAKEASYCFGKRIKSICEYLRKDLFGIFSPSSLALRDQSLNHITRVRWIHKSIEITIYLDNSFHIKPLYHQIDQTDTWSEKNG